MHALLQCAKCRKPLPIAIAPNVSAVICPLCRTVNRSHYPLAAPAPVVVEAPAASSRPRAHIHISHGGPNRPLIHARTVFAASVLLACFVAAGVTVAHWKQRQARQTFAPVSGGEPNEPTVVVADPPPPIEEKPAFAAALAPPARPISTVSLVVNSPAPTAAASVPAIAALPAAAGPEQAVTVPKPPRPIKRRSLLSDEELRRQLQLVPEISKKDIPDQSMKILATAPKHVRFARHEMPYLAGLPMRMGVDCQLGKEGSENLQALSRVLRGNLAAAMRDASDPRPEPDLLRHTIYHGKGSKNWKNSDSVPALIQLLAAENKPVRLLLVELLSAIPGPRASIALAQRAIFDLSEEVRTAAIRSLDKRPRDEYRAALLAGMRHIWAPVADHAAEALVAVNDEAAVSSLVKLLDEPDPRQAVASPTSGGVVRELVRVNHLNNCTMCHASSTSATDPVRGQVPIPGQPLPPLTQYYESTSGRFVRADITYLQQEFSVPQPVALPGAWPANQRYDYMVRERPITSSDIKVVRTYSALQTAIVTRPLPLRVEGTYDTGFVQRPKARATGYPQREAVLFAIRELSRPKAAELGEVEPTKTGE